MGATLVEIVLVLPTTFKRLNLCEMLEINYRSSLFLRVSICCELDQGPPRDRQSNPGRQGMATGEDPY